MPADSHPPAHPGTNGKSDPTLNVKEAMAFAISRIDDLRDAESRRSSEALRGVEKLDSERAAHLKELTSLRAEYTEKLALAEARRIDANRAGDLAGVAVASEKAAAQASVLANQLAASTETNRTLVASTAQAFATSLQQLVAPISDRVMKLEQSSYEGKGRQAFSDPRSEEIAAQVERLNNLYSTGVGKKSGVTSVGSVVGWVVGIVASLIALLLGYSHLVGK